MTTLVPQAQIDAANAYEALFVPALFNGWAPIMADAAAIKPGERVLDIACGTGVLAREAATRVGPAGHAAGLDPNAGMLAVAKSLAPDIDWREGKAEALPFPDCAFDAVVSQFGLMFFTDREQSVREMLRVLVRHGRCAAAVWDAIENAPAYADLATLFDRSIGKVAGDALRAPFALGDSAALVRLFETAGAKDVDVATHRGRARFLSIRELVEAELRGWLPVMGVNLSEAEIESILAESETVLAPYGSNSGEIEFDIHAHIVKARPS